MAALLGTAYWWNSLPREMFFYGMVGYAPAAYTSVLGVALLYRIARNPSLWSPTHLGWLMLALVIPSLHIQSIVIFLPPIVALASPTRYLPPQSIDLDRRRAQLFRFSQTCRGWLPHLIIAADDVSSAIVDQLPLFTSVDPFTFLKDYLGPPVTGPFDHPFRKKASA